MTNPTHPIKQATVAALILLGCPATEVADTGTAASESTGGSETTDTTTTDTDTETGEPCTGETCSSTLTLRFAHALPLLDGPHRFRIETPAYELVCSVEAKLEGDKSCFGFAFADLSWTSELVTVSLTNPFFDTENNPEATPFDAITVSVERGEEVLFEAQVTVVPGDAMKPDPCGPSCWHAVADAMIE
ncbi:hypothetical protein [Enhygromyxa salina]|uniref:Uncharacterized protein n=1 Tax=Enhygromyxa salina TaxID=215803 RepID=A0A2S9YMX3_9BACT|nr:hypothetical protein [Enhygromyxa salina]PRQ06436.1 hypothetical protein ENSA7_37550 [Enhygromyxa salina]